MKKILILAAASALLAACGHKGQTADSATASDSTQTTTDSLVFEGEIPGADGSINMRLALAQDSTKGFVLNEHYDKGDTTYTSTGKYEAITSGDKKGYKCMVSENEIRYFAAKNDSTITLVGDSTLTEEAGTKLSYDLKRK